MRTRDEERAEYEERTQYEERTENEEPGTKDYFKAEYTCARASYKAD